jgi:uncharacterized membrane protein (DUF2068 family)
MQRPTGVTIIAILSFLAAAGCILMGLLSFAGGAFVAGILKNLPGVGMAAGGLVAAFGAVFLAIGVLYAATGYGLWALKNWGRLIMMVLMTLGLIFGLIGLIGVFANFSTGMVVGVVIRLIICAWILWYLIQPEAKKAFGQA